MKSPLLFAYCLLCDVSESLMTLMTLTLMTIIEDLTNTANKYILHDMNQYPVLSVKAHTRPFERKWLNIIAAIIFPVGTLLYLRMWRFRLRLFRDLKVISQTNTDIIHRIREQKK